MVSTAPSPRALRTDLMLALCRSAGHTNATYSPARPASCSEKARSLANALATIGGRDATSLQRMALILFARAILSFFTDLSSTSTPLLSCLSLILSLMYLGREGALVERLFPSVLAMSGKTDTVSAAGNITTTAESALTRRTFQVGAVSGSTPYPRSLKLRLTEESVLEPKYTALTPPSSTYSPAVVKSAFANTPFAFLFSSSGSGLISPGTECWNSWLKRAVLNITPKPPKSNT
mmetsp:Transcript_19920/g.39892  ORF Transcript_19920/g.39892 Transcript_19920/m.39892 type:complete len:235 (-) Transcript_19920:17-721(-)